MLSLISSTLRFNAPASSASAAAPANNPLNPEQLVPTHEERTEAVTACLGQVLPRGIITLIAKQAMERFDDAMFTRQQWIDCWGATPVTFTKTLMELRCLVNLKLISGAQTEKPVDQMNEVECANFLQGIEVCRDDHFEPTDELYECLNRRVRPQDKVLAGFTCVVTYIPQFVRKDNRILAVTARTLASDLGPNPTGEGHVANLEDLDLDYTLAPQDVDSTEAPCYFVMERDVAPNTINKYLASAFESILQQGDKGWKLPEPRNFLAAVFSRYAWKGKFLYGKSYTYCQGKSKKGHNLHFGGFEGDGIKITEFMTERHGACGSRKFLEISLKEGI